MRIKTTAFTILCIAVLISVWFNSCKKPDHQPQTGNPTVPGTTNLKVTVTGVVHDNANNTIAGATVRCGSVTTLTDANGSFTLTNNAAAERLAITIVKTGFFKTTRTVAVRNNDAYQLKIEMIKKSAVYTFNGSSGGTVNFSGSSLIFPANSVTDLSGNVYTGIVSAACYAFNPASSNFTSIMPGNLVGIDANGQEQGLRSYAMVAVELADASGNELKVAPGKSVDINFAISSALQATAPAAIPLWYFNDSTGMWKQEGSATRSGTKYIASVQHFSYWNCDDPFSIVPFKLTVKLPDGSPLANTKVEFRGLGADSLTYGFGYTNSNGYTSGQLPSGKILSLKLSSLPCAPVLLSVNVGPYTAPVDLGTFVLNAVPASALYIINGMITTCENTPLPTGSIIVTGMGIQKTIPIVNGLYNGSWLNCQNGNYIVTLKDQYGITRKTDTLTLTAGTPYTYNNNSCSKGITVGINYPGGANVYGWLSTGDTLGSGYNNVTGKTELYGRWLSWPGIYRDIKLSISAPAGGTGNFVLNSFVLHVPEANGIPRTYTGTNMSVAIGEYSSVGGYMRGSFSGNVIDSATNISYPSDGTFYIKRTY